MPNLRQKPRGDIQCIYCGETKPPSQEHVIQDSIGGEDVIWEVCQGCNRSLSDIDDQLSVRSPLSLLGIRELGETGPRSWIYDPDEPGLLLEARGGVGTDAQKLYPQVLFRETDFSFHCDIEERDRLGPEELQKRFYTRLKEAYEGFDPSNKNPKRRDHKKRAMLTFRQIERLLPGEKLPPRIFCRTEVADFGDELTFELKYHTPGDDDLILERLRTFDWNYRAPKSKEQLGSDTATVNFPFCLTDVMRAVTKIGFNLLAFHCKATAPSVANFQRTVEWIKDCRHVAEFGDDTRFGFVHPAGVGSMNCPAGAHMFRLMHNPTTNTWRMYAAFFGGKAAVYVELHGPNNEGWSTMDVVAPYESLMLEPIFTKWYAPLDVTITKDPMEMMPSFAWTRGESHEERIPTR